MTGSHKGDRFSFFLKTNKITKKKKKGGMIMKNEITMVLAESMMAESDVRLMAGINRSVELTLAYAMREGRKTEYIAEVCEQTRRLLAKAACRATETAMIAAPWNVMF